MNKLSGVVALAATLMGAILLLERTAAGRRQPASRTWFWSMEHSPMAPAGKMAALVYFWSSAEEPPFCTTFRQC
ncbi:MAG TPA: hypothetical protein VFO40_04130 [Chthoniobacterales bacterium]|nr:hypothetical protein [Chthoniobacterales bacterium]